MYINVSERGSYNNDSKALYRVISCVRQPHLNQYMPHHSSPEHTHCLCTFLLPIMLTTSMLK